MSVAVGGNQAMCQEKERSESVSVRMNEHVPAVEFPGGWRADSVRGPALFPHVAPYSTPIDGPSVRTRDCAGHLGTLGYAMTTVLTYVHWRQAKVCVSRAATPVTVALTGQSHSSTIYSLVLRGCSCVGSPERMSRITSARPCGCVCTTCSACHSIHPLVPTD